MNQYSWNLSGFAKGIPADIAAQELERIEQVFGVITAETVLQASTPDDAVFHKLFEWDDSEAAKQYRLRQARTILNNIQVTIIADNAPRKLSAYEVVKNNNSQSYRLITTLSSDEIEQVKARTVRELNVLKNKLHTYKKFDSAITHLDAAIEQIQISDVASSGEVSNG